MFMNFLKIDEKKAHFILEEKEIKPENITRDDLLEILNLVYEKHSEIIFPNADDFSSIINPVEKEIVEQLTAKIKEFHTNVPDIKKEITSKFPKLDY